MTYDLLSYEPERRPVAINGKTLCEVRGLGVEDLGLLLNRHKDDVIAAAAAYQLQRHTIFSTRGLEQMVLTLITKFPPLAAEIIVVASDQPPAATENARKLPFATQARALSDIMALTFEDAGGLKNLLATLGKLVESVLPADLRAALESLPQDLSKSASRPSTGTAGEMRPS